jgi:hypothetical protein
MYSSDHPFITNKFIEPVYAMDEPIIVNRRNTWYTKNWLDEEYNSYDVLAGSNYSECKQFDGSRYSTGELLMTPYVQSLREPSHSVVKLVDSFFSNQKLTEPIYEVDKVLEREIAIGSKWIITEKFKYDSFNKSVKKIEENKIYNTNIFFNDLQDIDEIKGFRGALRSISKSLGFGELTNIDFLFNQIQNITDEQVLAYYGDCGEFDFLHEVAHIVEQREQIEYHLKLKALNRFIESEFQSIENYKQLRSVLSSPIILHLREYLDNIFNIKKIYPLTTLLVTGLFNFFNIKANGHSIRNRFIMFSN